MSIREIAQRVIALSKEYESKRRVHTEEHGVELGVKIGSRKAEHYLEATEKLPLKLERFLETPSLSDLLKLQTLVYFGCGDDDDVSRLHEYLKGTSPTREEIARTIASKVGALATYLESALEKADERGVDIERPFRVTASVRVSRRSGCRRGRRRRVLEAISPCESGASSRSD